MKTEYFLGECLWFTEWREFSDGGCQLRVCVFLLVCLISGVLRQDYDWAVTADDWEQNDKVIQTNIAAGFYFKEDWCWKAAFPQLLLWFQENHDTM